MGNKTNLTAATSAASDEPSKEYPEEVAGIPINDRKLRAKARLTIQPLSTDLEPAAPHVAAHVPAPAAKPAGLKVTAPKPADNSTSPRPDTRAVYPEPAERQQPKPQPKQEYKESKFYRIIPGLVIFVGLCTVFFSGWSVYIRLLAYTAETFSLVPTPANVFETVVWGMQALLGIGIIMRRDTARRWLIGVSAIVLCWSVFRIVMIYGGLSIISKLKVPLGYALAATTLASFFVVMGCLSSLFFLIFLTRRHVAEIFD